MNLIIYLISALISIYASVLLIYCITTWFIHDPSNLFLKALSSVTEPLLKPIRTLLYRFEFFRNSPIDFSSLMLFFILQIITNLLNRLSILF